MEDILALDTRLFLLIHLGGQNQVADILAPLFREKVFWSPLYVFVLVYLWLNERRWFWPFIIGVVTLITATDTLSSKIVKPAVGRLRPCKEVVLKEQVRPLVPCGSGFSFTSSHATNHFGLAAFMFFGMGFLQGRWKWLWWAWAGAISLSQVYVGVHYPGDILAGAGLGCLIGWIWSRGWTRYRLYRLNRET
ncbi:MAG: phosphatase PAP2 family protein [Saprospiraceae bacterium]|nr:phosphatase PAP2 family protein [Saprospiraceae bacterium]